MSYRSRNAAGDAWAVIARRETETDWAERVERARAAGTLCPTCHEIPLTAYEHRMNYQCARCTQQAEG